MNPKPNFNEISYDRHTKTYEKFSIDGEEEALAKTWFETDTVDAWRHQRMYKLLDPIIDADKNAKWLTVGDGRYGKDGNYIQQKGCDVLVTDISSNLLKEAKDIGYISKYKQENAESLSFQDDEFDYVFCKQAYHHFSRTMLALYEMLRVARKGVILIEPNDICINEELSKVFFRSLKNINNIKLMDYVILGAIIFKRKPAKELLQQLVNRGYRIIHLSKNPYIAD